MRSKVNAKGRQRSPLKSKPREPEGTIVGDMLLIMQLIEDNKRLKGVK
jgi:hypothetical protein